MWTSTWSEVAPKWVQIRGPSCAILEPSWAEVGAEWAQVGKLGPCWLLTPSGAHVAAMSGRNGAFERCWADLQKGQMTTVLCISWRCKQTPHVQTHKSLLWHCFVQQCPPPLKLYQTDRWAHSYLAARLPRFGTFGAGGLKGCMYMHTKKCLQRSGETMCTRTTGDDEQSPSAPSSLGGSIACNDAGNPKMCFVSSR